MINVMIVDDHSIIREGLSMTLSLCDDINICGEASNGKEAIEFLEKHYNNVDVVLSDIRMPVMDGVEATKIIKEKFDNIKILILTTFKEEEYIFEALKNGADGYILKDAKSEEIIKGIKTVHSGNVLLQPEIAAKVVKAFNTMMTSNDSSDVNKSIDLRKEQNEIKGKYESLTARESEIARLVSDGKSNKEISEILFITEGTVKNHLTKILGKLEVRDRTQLALYIKQYD
ncbi:response regulator transcription factor [Oceanirhabdus sp. W0125-5]|uniref:response regulator transcription factor n=1 Tax=Oceanirhabdus sp. W0125-5 TaxID=2999116 RepID=UPI0022F2E110|nr:response regulator transcription factor [Oceanirhabdus sp. W0125-5]WBW96729.1 response regulator transcription factor [Oceanirhabdus sp. W0125-5]